MGSNEQTTYKVSVSFIIIYIKWNCNDHSQIISGLQKKMVHIRSILPNSMLARLDMEHVRPHRQFHQICLPMDRFYHCHVCQLGNNYVCHDCVSFLLSYGPALESFSISSRRRLLYILCPVCRLSVKFCKKVCKDFV